MVKVEYFENVLHRTQIDRICKSEKVGKWDAWKNKNVNHIKH